MRELGLLPLCAVYGLETRLSPTERIRVLALDLQHICAENGYKTWLATNDEIWVIPQNVQPTFAEYWCDSLQAKKLVQYLSTYNLSAVKMSTKHDSGQMLKIVYWQSNYSQWIWSREMTRASQKFLVLAPDLPNVFAKYVLDTWLAPNEEMSNSTLIILSFSTEYELVTWLATTEQICVFLENQHSMSPKYALEKGFTKLQHMCDEIILARTKEFLVLILLLAENLNIKANVSKMYVSTIHTLKLLAMLIFHISPRILIT